MTAATQTPGTGAQHAELHRTTGQEPVRLVRPAGSQAAGAEQTPLASEPAGVTRTRARGRDHSPASPAMRPWPLLILALPAAIAVWSGWVGIGQLTGFGQVRPLPGIWNSLHLNTAITLPVGVEAYAAYALRAWLTASTAVSDRTRRFARRSATGSLLLGMAGQAAYHLLAQNHITRAPWAVTTAVSCLPVLILGMGAALAHLLHADTHTTTPADHTGPGVPGPAPDHANRRPDHARPPALASRLAEAQTAAAELAAAGQHVSRRALRTAGLHGSNADLGAPSRMITSRPGDGTSPARPGPARRA